MIGVTTSPPHVSMFRKFNVWYSIKDGNWSDPSVWESNQAKRYSFPQPGDTVYIGNTLTCDVSISLNNLYISGTLKFNGVANTITVNGDLQATGSVDQSGGANTIVLSGFNNFINTFTAGTTSNITYSSNFTQSVMPLAYAGLSLISPYGSASQKIMSTAVTTTGNLLLSATLNTNNFNFTVGGATNFNNQNAIASIISSGNLLFIGGILGNVGRGMTVIGTATIECRGGVRGYAGLIDATNSNINFTTNNQTISGLLCNNITVVGPITVTTDAVGLNYVIAYGIINGTVAGSTFTNAGWLELTNPTLPMATGIFNYRTGTTSSQIYYNFNGNYTLPYTVYDNLYLSGTGVKSVSGNITVGFNLNLSMGVTTGSLELSTYNLTVNGTTNTGGAGGTLSKNGSGTVLFVGVVTLATGSYINFTGNPSVEIRGGINVANGSINFGTGTTSFTTNSQTIITGTGASSFYGPVVIGSGVTLTRSADTFQWIFTNSLTGIDASSIFNNLGIVNYQYATAPMLTGKLYCNQSVNTFIYGLGGNQDITVPSDATPGYRNLTLNGSGAKRLLGNVSVKNIYTLTTPATLNSNGFALTNP